nr:hypothetical protein CFP56_10373 [Quercus suber]
MPNVIHRTMADAAQFQYPQKATVDVLVGPEKKLFVVYENIFVARSPYFLVACLTGQKAKKILVLPSDDPETFNSYIAYACSKALTDETSPELLHLIQVYCLANRLGDWQTSNDLMDKMLATRDGKSEVPTVEDITYAYSQSVKGSLLRRMIVDLYLHRLRHDRNHSALLNRVDAPMDFMRDLALQFVAEVRDCYDTSGYRRERRDLNPCTDYCSYHQHDEIRAPWVGYCKDRGGPDSAVEAHQIATKRGNMATDPPFGLLKPLRTLSAGKEESGNVFGGESDSRHGRSNAGSNG